MTISIVIPKGCNMKNVKDPKPSFPEDITSPQRWTIPEIQKTLYIRAIL
jgi:hypothetical protein